MAISLHVLSNVAGNYQEVLKTVDLKSGVAFLSIAWLFLQFFYVFLCIRFNHVWKAPGLFSFAFFLSSWGVFMVQCAERLWTQALKSSGSVFIECLPGSKLGMMNRRISEYPTRVTNKETGVIFMEMGEVGFIYSMNIESFQKSWTSL